MLLHQGGQHDGDQPGYAKGGRQDHCRTYRITLVRHSGRTAATLVGRLEDFVDFRLRHQRNVARHLAERANQQAEQSSDFSQAVAM